MISYGRHSINDQDIEAVVDVLKSDYLTQGPVSKRFEQECRQYLGVEYAHAVSNGTAALHLACLALGISEDDDVWVPTISFLASANCVRFCGANVHFIDCHKKTGNVDLDYLEDKLKRANEINKLPKAIIVVHMGGYSCEMEAIANLSKNYGFKVIEDAAHSLGAKYKDTKVGSCRYSDISIFSFHPVKNITTGEGGLVTTNSPQYSKSIEIYKCHGLSNYCGDSLEPWEYEQTHLGYNYRLSDINSSLGCSQLSRIDEFLSKRRAIALGYQNKLPSNLIYQRKLEDSAHHLYVIHVDPSSKSDFYNYMLEHGFKLQVHYKPIHTQPYYNSDEDLKGANTYYKSAISLPIFPDMDSTTSEKVITLVRDFYA